MPGFESAALRELEGESQTIRDIYRVHPLLDPLLPSRHPAEIRRWLTAYRALRAEPSEGQRLMRAFVSPVVGDPQAAHQSVESYFQDADDYLDDLLCLASREEREVLRPLAETRALLDFGSLLRVTFEGEEPRQRYEAQRKLYLARLLFDIDHCRSVRDGPRHRELLEALLQRSIWSLQRGTRAIVAADLRFEVRELSLPGGELIDVYHHHLRSKREPGPDGGSSTCRPASKRRSGSILSKMIRKGIGDPHLVSDLLGASFVVGDRRQAYALERALVDALGGPFRWRDRVDTLSSERDRTLLDRNSKPGFRVIKQLVEILTEDPSAASPYLFPVEVQLFTFGDYLATLSGAEASHAAYKRRQFVNGLLPVLFPSRVFSRPAQSPLRAVAG